MSKFKVGDRVEWVGGPTYKDPEWQFMRGVRATVYQIVDSGLQVHWDDHEDNEPREGRVIRWYTGTWENEDF